MRTYFRTAKMVKHDMECNLKSIHEKTEASTFFFQILIFKTVKQLLVKFGKRQITEILGTKVLKWAKNHLAPEVAK